MQASPETITNDIRTALEKRRDANRQDTSTCDCGQSSRELSWLRGMLYAIPRVTLPSLAKQTRFLLERSEPEVVVEVFDLLLKDYCRTCGHYIGPHGLRCGCIRETNPEIP